MKTSYKPSLGLCEPFLKSSSRNLKLQKNYNYLYNIKQKKCGGGEKTQGDEYDMSSLMFLHMPCPTIIVFFLFWVEYSSSENLRDKTMVDKFVNFPNDDKQNNLIEKFLSSEPNKIQ